MVWSDKNDKTPYDYAPFSNYKVWWKCENGIHDDYKLAINNQNGINHFQCIKCRSINNKTYSIYADLTDQKFGILTAIFQCKDNRRYWYCNCDCGTKNVKIDGYKLITGHTTSCGCRHHLKGKESCHWRGGITPLDKVIRHSDKYVEWRDSIFERDNYICQCCGTRKNLNAHHIESFATNIDLRFDINNGITLCEKCHMPQFEGSFHNIYGTSKNTRIQLEEYLQNRKLNLA